MVYIIVLNWKGAKDTIACLKSLSSLCHVEYKIIVCDNASPDNSYEEILTTVKFSSSYFNYTFIELSRLDAENYRISKDEKNEHCLYFIQTGANLGFAGGNNVGIRFALNQADMQYVWLLNNDTVVEPEALSMMVARCQSDSKIGICGSRLVYYHDRTLLQGVGGVYNKWLGTTHHYAANFPSTTLFNDQYISERVDYVIGASMLLTRHLLINVGLLCEDYFLYFEELDISHRAKQFGLTHSVCTTSIVYHKEGGSSGGVDNKSDFADFLAIKNRVLFCSKFYRLYLPTVWLGLFVVVFNRLRRSQYKKAVQVLRVISRVCL